MSRPRVDRELAPQWVDAENVLADLADLVEQALDEGAMTLAEVTARVLSELPETTRYAATGRVADVLARVCAIRSERERRWVPVERLEIQDWMVLERESSS